MTETKTVTWLEWAEWVRQQLRGHQDKLKFLTNEVALLRSDVDRLDISSLGPKVLELLRNENKPRTWTWIKNRLSHIAWNPLQDLIRTGLVIETRPKKFVMYVAKES